MVFEFGGRVYYIFEMRGQEQQSFWGTFDVGLLKASQR